VDPLHSISIETINDCVRVTSLRDDALERMHRNAKLLACRSLRMRGETVKLGLGLYQHMLTPENFRFARQAGATHIVAHLIDYFAEGPRIPQSGSKGQGWG
jgi:hypothetical protein